MNGRYVILDLRYVGEHFTRQYIKELKMREPSLVLRGAQIKLDQFDNIIEDLLKEYEE